MSRNREEAEIVEGIKLALELKGFIVARVNQYQADKSGTDVVGDLFVTHKEWDTGDWINGEVKTQRGKLSSRRPVHRDGTYGYSQRDLFEMGRLFLWRNSEEALGDCMRTHREKMKRKGG